MSRLKGEEIVISGISGIFPDAENVHKLSEKLYDKIDMVSKKIKHPNIKHPEFPQYYGAIKDMEKFDGPFFRVTPKQAQCMDPVTKKLMEQAFSALFDAGVNPESLKSSRLGVYIASMQIDSVNFLYNDMKTNPFFISGASKCMLANRISYWIDGKGPSYSIDHGCAGSMSALQLACSAMKNGEIDCAIIGSNNYCDKPELSMNMKRAGLLCLDGKTKCFDKNGDGYVRSDAVTVYFLQRAKDANRVYAEVYDVKSKYFASPDGLFSSKRNSKDIEQFLEEFYSKVDVSPNDVEYVEANSFGIAEADGNELESIGNVFCKDKSIKIGSIKSNIGNTEAASGSCAVTKMCIAYQKGLIPANLHYSEPQNHIATVKQGKVKVVTENLPFGRNFTAINNFCYTGSNFHTLLKGHYIPKDKGRHKSSIPRLVLVSSRQEKGVNKMLNILENNPIDPEQLALLNKFFKHNVSGYTARGYTILDSVENNSNKTVSLSRGFEYYSGITRPLWFMYSGMGSQWAGMGEGLMRIPVFAAAIERCHKVLHPKNLNIVDIITDKDAGKLNILNSLVAITAIQIGLTDVLKSIGIYPNNIIGHSIGEIASGYADGSLTTEQAILAAYIRALVSHEANFIKGTMAAVGLGHKEVAELCPPEIALACHNSFESTTISGPAEIVSVFVKSLTDRGIFAKEVSSYNIAFHSQYIAEAGPKMNSLLKEVLADPKKRSKKWLSTCYLPEHWHKPESQYASAEYFTHNLMGSVLFEEAAAFIPEDAIILEIAPHGLLQAILKRSHKECLNLSLTRRGEADGATLLLKTIGSLYQAGLNPDLASLYPKVEFPVSTETPFLSHLVEWDHDMDWLLADLVQAAAEPSITKEFIFSPVDDEFAYLKSNIQNGVIVLPEAALLVFTWETLASFGKKDYKNTTVVFDDVQFYGQITIQPKEVLRLTVSVQKGSSKFEIRHKTSVVADGTITFPKKCTKQYSKIICVEDNDKQLTQNDICTILRTRGYFYSDEFASILSTNIKRNKGTVIWNEHWVTFLNSLVQMKALSCEHDGISWVKFINKLTINTDEHKYRLLSKNAVQCYNALVSEDTGVTECGGVIFENIIFNDVPKTEYILDLEKYLRIKKHHNKVIAGKNKKLKQVKLISKNLKNIESLAWADTSVLSTRATVQVQYAGLSMRDSEKLGKPNNNGFGMDFSGIDVNGRRVMGLIPASSIASTVEADYDLLWSVPEHWTLAEAATVPLPYIHAFYCLAIRHTLYRNNTIMVIGAAGALGQAVISIALHLGCRVFGTVANADKKRFLLKLFPQLEENNIGYTYDDTFPALIIKRTNNRRCNIVINTATGKIREEAMNCVGDDLLFNFFLDVNESDQKENKQFNMAYLDVERSYKSVNMSTIFKEKYMKYKKDLQLMLCEGIAKGFVRPLTSVLYLPSEISRAFKLLSNRSNRGRVLISIKDLETTKLVADKIPRLTLSSDKINIVVSDGSELGVELINLLIRRGARRFIINCNPKSINGYFHVYYAAWIKNGANIELNSADLRKGDESQKIVNDAIKLGPIDGIFITHSDFKTENTIQVIDQNKSQTALIVTNLDKNSRSTKDLRHFAVITATQSSADESLKLIEKHCLVRNDIGLPSLHLHHDFEDKIWHQESLTILLNALETSLLHKFVSVSTCLEDSILKQTISKETKNINFNAGFKAFYHNIPNDEFDATEPIVQLKTMRSLELEHELNLDPSDNYIFMIPGFDGNSECLAYVAERLKKSAMALQTIPEFNDNISKIAKNLLNHLNLRFKLRSPFYLMGYSFGVNIALEMAALLEKEGYVGTVCCLDSSPDALRTHLDAYLGSLTDEQLQDALIEHIYTLLVGQKSINLKTKLKETINWSDKVEICIQTAKTYVAHTHEYMRNFIQAAYERVKMAKEYKPKFVLESELVLIKGIPHPDAQELSDDYGLSAYTNKPVQVFDINSDHAMALNDCRVTNFINRTIVL